MCHPVRCPKCGKPTWAGCGRHVEEALAGVAREKRCACPPPDTFLSRLFGPRGS